MSDEIKKDEAPEKESTDKPKAVKKTTAAKKEKASAKPDSEQGAADNKIIDKLKAMGVMAGGKKNDDIITSDKSIFPFVAIMSVLVVVIVGYLIWTLNKNVEDDYVASTVNNVQPVAQRMPQYNNRNNGPYSQYNRELQQRMQVQQEQYNKWVQQQQQAQEQRRAQQQKWAQQPPTQEQYRTQQKKWAQQQQQAREQQRVQQQNWAQQWQKAQEQQRAQQQQRARSQQPYFANPQSGYQGQPYNYASRYQQPGPYYGPQY